MRKLANVARGSLQRSSLRLEASDIGVPGMAVLLSTTHSQSLRPSSAPQGDNKKIKLQIATFHEVQMSFISWIYFESQSLTVDVKMAWK